LDPDATGYVRPARCKRAIEAMYRDRFNISVTIQDAQAVLASMENTILTFYLFIVILICVGLYSGTSDFNHGLTSISAVLVAWSFVFGSSMARSFEGLIFLFNIHLFDVGDTLLLPDGNYYTVNRIRVLATDFLRDDGCFVRLENSVLRTQHVVNLTTSKQKNQLLDFYVHSYDMTPELLQSMNDDLDVFVRENCADYTGYHITVRNFVHNAASGGRGDNGNFCRVAVWLRFQKLNIDIYACHLARQNFLLYVCKILRKNGIEPPSQSNLNKARAQAQHDFGIDQQSRQPQHM
jgi:small-conductance mechanosensitive channel